ncbi:RHS repeat domain-containing protein, partial [Arsukibacterium sp.]|uniref:RHS repeat domain-containing protein n=1 Tax=Arsukibacterium sp. TaxID=1977258 RepID=UPI002FD9ABA4
LTDRYGFRATSPEGTVYIFDVVRLVPASLISVAQEAESVDPNYPLEVILRTFSLNVQVSSITDRFGNWVRYHYEATSIPPGIAASMLTYSNKLRKIEANDGRVIDIFYEAGSHSDRIRRVVAEGQTWSYLYRTEYDVTDQLHKDILHEVVRPDGKKWQFNLAFDKFGGYENSGWMGILACMNTDHFLPLVSTLTHPEGAVFRLTQRATRFGRTAVPVNLRDHHDVSRCFNNVAVIKKELLLADENLTWQYSYSQNPGSPKGMLEHSNTPQPAPLTGLPFTPAGHHLLDLRSTTTLNPDGSKTVHVFDRKFGVLEGEEVLTLHYDTDGSSLLQSVRKTFTVQPKTGKVRLVSCKPSQYPVIDIDHNKCLKAFDNQAKEEHHRYLHQLLTTQYHNGVGTTFSKEYSHYNSYGQPELIKESSSFGQRFTRNSYQHNTAIWVLNLPLKTEVSADGQHWQTVSETSYYSPAHVSRLLPYQQRYFGMLYSTNTYHADGNIRRQSYNAAHRWVEYGHYKRGTPQHIMLPGRYQAASTQSATQVVNNRGEIASVTNFLGQTTHYNYDVMGRLTRITPPSPWQRTEISYGNSAGRFIQTISRGQYQKRIEMDALMRPVLTRETDTARNINIFVRQRFDAYNQPVFQSVPSYSSAATSGFVTQYDGLQRRRRHFTNVDNTGTDYYYLAGNRVMTVDAMGNQTTTTYRALGAPEQHLPQHIAQPEGVTTLLAYNLFDNVISISQGGITESRFYNSQQRLCRVARTDVGATAYEYNAVGDLLWLAQGASGANSGCFTSSVLAGEKSVIFGKLPIRTAVAILFIPMMLKAS